jgi:hypothetical protein
MRIIAAVVASLLAAVCVVPGFAAQPAARHILFVQYPFEGTNRIVDLAADGKILWEHTPPSIAVVIQPLPDGHVLYAYGGKPTGVQEVDRDHKVVWNFVADCEQVFGCERLPDGSTLVAEQGPPRVLRVSAKGEVLSTINIPLKEQPAHNQIRCVHGLPSGNVIVCNEKDGVVREVDPSGKVVWEFEGVPSTYDALRLPSGNTLISCGTDKRVIEVTPDKKIVWELKASDVPDVVLNWPTSLQVLANGNLFIGNFLRGQEKSDGAHAFEVTREKKVVWKFADHAMAKLVTNAKALE